MPAAAASGRRWPGTQPCKPPTEGKRVTFIPESMGGSWEHREFKPSLEECRGAKGDRNQGHPSVIVIGSGSQDKVRGHSSSLSPFSYHRHKGAGHESLGWGCCGTGCKGPVRRPYNSYFDPSSSVSSKCCAALETGQGDGGQGKGAKEKTKTPRKYCKNETTDKRLKE